MQTVNIYTSQPSDQGLAGVMLAMSQNLKRPVVLLPLEAMPEPDLRFKQLQRLRIERMEVERALVWTEWCLEQYRHGAWSADAGHQQGLQFDLDALKTRLGAD